MTRSLAPASGGPATASSLAILDAAWWMYRHPHDGGGWAIAVALLARQALEMAAMEFWTGRAIDMGHARASSSLIALRYYVNDAALAREAQHVWCALSEATHYGAYDLAPTTGELHAWLESVADVIARLSAGSTP